jgi:hypothetical protein
MRLKQDLSGRFRIAEQADQVGGALRRRQRRRQHCPWVAQALIERLNVIGLEVMGTGTPEEFGSFLQIEPDKWAKWVNDAGIQPE